MNEPEVFILQRHDRYSIEVWYREPNATGWTYYSYDGENMVATQVEQNQFIDHEDPKLKPLMRMPINIGEAMLPLLVAEMERKNIKPINTVKNEGKIEAMEKHLSDMRKIVFNKLKIIE